MGLKFFTMKSLGTLLGLILIFNPTRVCAQTYEIAQGILPVNWTQSATMDIAPIDADQDGDMDLVLANEFEANALLILEDDGTYRGSRAGMDNFGRDSEDIAVADFNLDGIDDIIICSEDDVKIGRQNVHEYYLGQGNAQFTKASFRFPDSEANAVMSMDVNTDGEPDVLFGNNGPTTLFINNGDGTFRQENRFSSHISRVTQDLQKADVDDDGDLDIIEGNEDGNVLWINDGNGFFADSTASHLPNNSTWETRKVTFNDVDDDGNIDIFLSQVAFRPGKLAQNVILINDGFGHFQHQRVVRVPLLDEDTLDGIFEDVNGDGYDDIIAGQVNLRIPAPQRCFVNSGGGIFTDETDIHFPSLPGKNILATLLIDVDGDGQSEIYLADRGGFDVILKRAIPSSTTTTSPETQIQINGQSIMVAAEKVNSVWVLNMNGHLFPTKKRSDADYLVNLPVPGMYLAIIQDHTGRAHHHWLPAF